MFSYDVAQAVPPLHMLYLQCKAYIVRLSPLLAVVAVQSLPDMSAEHWHDLLCPNVALPETQLCT